MRLFLVCAVLISWAGIAQSQSSDPIVRVQANKLRMRLKAYYAVAAPPPRCKSKYRRAPMFRSFGSTRRRIPVDGTGCA